MSDYILELPQDKKDLFHYADIKNLDQKDVSSDALNLLGFELSKLKYNQFAHELFLFFYNLEVYGIEDYKNLFDTLFKRLMTHWVVILPLTLEITSEVQQQFEERLYQQLLSMDELSIVVLYKQWIRLWDNWIIKHRFLLIDTLNQKFQFLN
ncbi:hypothetical protein L3V81_07575 [Thiotrichales bacterium 19S3-11]|nr:hypothetical protein [Thiotrichales bacterium 19S3-11]